MDAGSLVNGNHDVKMDEVEGDKPKEDNIEGVETSTIDRNEEIENEVDNEEG